MLGPVHAGPFVCPVVQFLSAILGAFMWTRSGNVPVGHAALNSPAVQFAERAPELPKGPTGKVLKAPLRALAGNRS